MVSDTHPLAKKFQIELLRQASVPQRIAAMRSLTSMVVQLSRRAIARANPELSEQDVNLKWVEVHYGKELAQGLREHLKRQ